MPFAAQNRLEEALVAAVHQPASAPDFYRLLLESDLLVLGTVEGHEGDTPALHLEPGGRFALVSGERNGARFLPVFSSLARMQDYVSQESKYIVMKGRALFDLTRGAPVILNPASEYGKELSPQQIAQLLDPPGGRLQEGQMEYPAALVKGMTALLREHAEISTAWMIQVDTGGDAHPLVGIEFETGGDMAALMIEIQAMAQRDVPGLVFDIQQVDRARPSGLAPALLQAQPFYQRSDAGRILN